MELTPERKLAACVLAIFVIRAAVAGAIVPPWQNPDEPVHFVLVQMLATPLVESLHETERVLQGHVVRSMIRHDWWRPYGMPNPDPPPSSFNDRRVRSLGAGTYAQPLYYGLGAAALRLARPADVDAAYWILRSLSVVLGVATLLMGWAGTRLVFGPTVAAGAAAITALHPQFLLTSLGVNPDTLAIALGAFVWWQLARAATGRAPGMSLALVLIGAAALVMTKRNVLPLAAAAVVAAVMLPFVSDAYRGLRRRVLLLMGAGAAAAIVIGAWLVPDYVVVELWRLWANVMEPRAAGTFTPVTPAEHARRSIDYAWLMAGWLRFPPPDRWLWAARILTAVGAAGAVVLFVTSRALRARVALASWLVLVQVAATVGATFWAVATPQGRYFFPVLAPAAALLWLGVTSMVPARMRLASMLALLGGLAVLDITAFTTVLIPAYLHR